MARPVALLLSLALTSLSACSDTEPAPPDAQPGRAVQCDYNGTLYDDGVLFTADDGCNSCKCHPLGARPGEWQCTAKACPSCPNTFVEQYDCPAGCTQESLDAVPPFWCASFCTTKDECAGYECNTSGYCVPPCTVDADCTGTAGRFARCDKSLGLCTFD